VTEQFKRLLHLFLELIASIDYFLKENQFQSI